MTRKAILHKPTNQEELKPDGNLDDSYAFYWSAALDPYDGKVVNVDISEGAMGNYFIDRDRGGTGFNPHWLEYLPDDDPREPVI